MRLAVLGAGAWGTALAIEFCRRRQTTLWTWRSEHAAAMRSERCNQLFLPDFPLPEDLQVSDDFAAAVADIDLAIIATPVAGLRECVAALRDKQPDAAFLWACKGLETSSGMLPHQVVAAEHPGAQRCGVLSGPSFAREVASGLPAAIVIASADADFAAATVAALHGPQLRLYANDDIIGVEVGGAVKNVLAIAAGISDGLGLGLNARAALLTRGLAEISRFGVALGGRSETFMGLTGMGDLLLTCTGDLSRNRQVGLALAAGASIAEIQQRLGHVAEGVATAREVAARAAALNVDMPLTASVCAVLEGRMSAPQAVECLLRRELRPE